MPVGTEGESDPLMRWTLQRSNQKLTAAQSLPAATNYGAPTMSGEYVFSISAGSGEARDLLEFMFVLDEGMNPIKLGDGSYGAVFKVTNGQNDMFAVKILYDRRVREFAQTRLADRVEALRRSERLNQETLKILDELFGSDYGSDIETAALQRFRYEMEAKERI